MVSAGIGLDDEAVRRVGDLGRELAVDDLRRSGWAVEDPAREADGRTWVWARRPFADPAEGDRLLASLSGPGGPFQQLHLTRRPALFRDRLAVSGLLDFSGGPTALSDPALQALVAQHLPLDDPALRRGLRSELRVRLGGTERIFRAGVGERVPVHVAAHDWDDVGLGLLGAALASGVAALVLLLRRRSNRS